MPVPAPLSPEGYAARHGRICPACGGTDLARHAYEQAGPQALLRAWECENCGASWCAVYTLTGYERLRQHTEGEAS